MKRRDFLKVASGAAGGAAAVGTTTASSGSSRSLQEGNESDGNESGGGGGNQSGGGAGNQSGSEGGSGQASTETVEVGPNGNFVFKPGTNQPLKIAPGTTVKFVWKSDTHNIVVESQPDEANWKGHEKIEDTGFEYEHAFEVEGTYEYYCEPHRSAGMVGTIEVSQGGGGGGGPVTQDPHEMGVPFQAHFVGIATILMMFVSLVYTFFVLKYGESRHASAPNKK